MAGEEAAHSWDRQPNEGAASHNRFTYYLQLKPRRHEPVAEHFGIKIGTVYNDASRYRWSDRADDYDRWVQEQAAPDDITALATEQANVHRMAVDAVKHAVELATQVLSRADPDQLTRSEESIAKTVLSSLAKYAMPTEADSTPELTVSWSPASREKLLRQLADEAQSRADRT